MKRKSKAIVILISLLIFIICAFSISVVANYFKKSDPIPEGDAYGAYYDDSASKIKEKNIKFDSEEITLKYIRTENLKEKPVAKRADSYGTYDIYTDNNQTEYLFLLNTDVCCGFKMSTVGVATLAKDAVSREEALSISNEFLQKMRTNNGNYELKSCVYSDLAGYYDIEYSFSTCGYKTDNVFRVWVNAQGEVTSFSEFNYMRYDNLNIDAKKYASAFNKLDSAMSKAVKNTDFEIIDEYISIDDSGKLILVRDINADSADDIIQCVQPIK